MLTAQITYANGRQEMVDIDIIDTGKPDRGITRALTAHEIGKLAQDAADRATPHEGYTGELYEPTTTRRPLAGEIWRARCGALVAVLAPATVLDGGWQTVVLTRGSLSRTAPGYNMVHALDGRVHGSYDDRDDRPYDLVKYERRFL